MDNKPTIISSTALSTQTNKAIMPKTGDKMQLSDNHILVARKTKKLSECDDSEIKGAVVYIMLQIGLTTERITEFSITIEDNIKKTSPRMQALVSSIRQGYPALRIQEIATAFDMAVADVFEAETRLFNKDFNFQFVGNILTKYKNYRKSTLKKEVKMIDTSERDRIISEEEQQKLDTGRKKLTDQGMKAVFDTYKKCGVLPDGSAWIYLELEKRGVIIDSVDFKRSLMPMAKDILKVRLAGRKKNATHDEIKKINVQLQDFDHVTELKIIGRELALMANWDILIQSNKEFIIE